MAIKKKAMTVKMKLVYLRFFMADMLRLYIIVTNKRAFNLQNICLGIQESFQQNQDKIKRVF